MKPKLEKLRNEILVMYNKYNELTDRPIDIPKISRMSKDRLQCFWNDIHHSLIMKVRREYNNAKVDIPIEDKQMMNRIKKEYNNKLDGIVDEMNRLKAECDTNVTNIITGALDVPHWLEFDKSELYVDVLDGGHIRIELTNTNASIINYYIHKQPDNTYLSTINKGTIGKFGINTGLGRGETLLFLLCPILLDPCITSTLGSVLDKYIQDNQPLETQICELEHDYVNALDSIIVKWIDRLLESVS